MEKYVITLFGKPSATVDGEPVDLGPAYPLLAALVLWRQSHPIRMPDVVDMLKRPDSQADDQRSRFQKQKPKLQSLLKLPEGQTLADTAKEVSEQAWVDVIQFDKDIESDDIERVRKAVQLRKRGPLLANQPDILGKERKEQDRKYRIALDHLIKADRHTRPKEALQSIYLLLACAGLSEQSRQHFHQEQLTIQNEIFNEKPVAGDSKTTQLSQPLKLPFSPTPLIGREAQVDTIKELLASSRLVTLTGTAGIGKTRLALALAHSLRENFPYGTGFIDLTDGSDVAEQVGMYLGLQKGPGRSWQEALLAFLEDKNLLLVWDNCEHLVEACITLASQVLKHCPSVRLLVTSREPLRTDGEMRYRVPSLSHPTSDEDTAPESLSEYSAIRLFLARAKAVKTDFCLTAQNSPVIAKICRDLDGLPLAIGIAASLIDVCEVKKLTAKLLTRFELLAEGPHTETSRHRSLWAAFDVSYDLLSPAEQKLFRRLSVFAGSFSAEAVAAVSTDADSPPMAALSLLSQLVRKSLVEAEPQDEEMRYRLLLTVRQYAHDRLREQGEENETCRKHRDHFLALAEEAAPQLRGPEQKRLLDRLETDHDNFRAALTWRVDEASLRLACALQRFWWVRGYLEEGRRWLERDVKDDASVPEEVRARVLVRIGRLAQAQGEIAKAQNLYKESLTLQVEQRDGQEVADVFTGLGSVAEHLGDYAEASGWHRKSMELSLELGYDYGIATALYGLAIVHQNQDNYPVAIEMQQESLTLRRKLGDVVGIGNSLSQLGDSAYMQGRFEDAKLLYEESLVLWQALGQKRGIAQTLSALGSLARVRSDYGAARHIYSQSLALFQDVGDKYGVANTLNGLASLAYNEGNFERARELMERCLALLQTLGGRSGIATLLSSLGSVARQQKRFAEAKKLLTEGLVLHKQLEEKSFVANSLGEIAFLAAAEGEYHRAARLWSAEGIMSELVGCGRPPNEDAPREQAISGVRQALSAEEFAVAWAEGRAMNWEQAVAYALGEDGP